jgi:hypothetical protein
MWRKSLSAIWRKGKGFRSNLSDYKTVSRRRDDLLRDSFKVVDLQLFARSESEDGSIGESFRHSCGSDWQLRRVRALHLEG